MSLALAASMLIFDFFQTREKFPFQTFIGRVNVSGLTQDEAKNRLRQLQLEEIYAPLVTFEGDGVSLSFPPQQAGIRLDLPQTIKKAFALTHDEGYLLELKKRLTSLAIRSPLVLSIDEEELRRLVSGISESLHSAPRNASFIFNEETGGYHIEPEVLGRELQVEETISLIKEKLQQGEKVFPLIIKEIEPALSEKMLREAPPAYRLSAYTTYYGTHDSPNRIHNIRLVASWIDGKVLLPGEVFSVADNLGEITPARGFKEAFAIIKGELVPVLGGGSCQIATTLYNAATIADLKILERRNHSFYFNIYPLGRDAAVFPGQVDFKFENDTGHPLLIKAVATNRRLSFRFYGTPHGRTVKFSPPEVFIKTEGGYRPSTVKTVLKSDSPFRTIVTRTVTDRSGKKLKEERIVSNYKLYGEKENVPIARPEPR